MANQAALLLFFLVVVLAKAKGDHVKGQRALKRKRHGYDYQYDAPPTPDDRSPPTPYQPLHSSYSSASSSKKSKASNKSKGKGGPPQPPGPHGYEITLKITNLTYLQPFSNFIVILHNRDADPLFVLGEKASDELAILAENGDPGPLREKYDGAFGVKYVDVLETDFPLFGGQTTYIKVAYERSYPLITVASMAINTNDCFVALNGVYLSPGITLHVPGYDAGSEVNNELCSSIPGPACPSGSGNVRSGNGEGYVHIHRGFKGVGDRLSEAGYDWRNPMMQVEVYM